MIKIFSILVFLTTLDKKFGSSVSFSSEDAAPTVNLSTKKLKLVVNVSDKKKIEKNLMSQVWMLPNYVQQDNIIYNSDADSDSWMENVNRIIENNSTTFEK